MRHPREIKIVLMAVPLAAVFFLSPMTTSSAQSIAADSAAAADKKPELFRMKSLKGTVVAKTRYNLSIETSIKGSVAYEIMLPVNEKTKLRGFRNTSELVRGSVISAKYKEKYEIQEDGSELVTGKEATEIDLIRGGSESAFVSKEGKA